MRKNGFIATSLIYSFFLVFCAVILGYIGTSTHNKNLLNKANDNIRNDILEKSIGDINLGTYINLDLSTSLVDLKDVKWQTFSKNIEETLLVSSKEVFTSNDDSYIDYFISTLHHDCINNKIRILSKKDLFVTIKNNFTDIRLLKSILNSENTNSNSTYALVDGDILKKYTYPNSDSDELINYQSATFDTNNLDNYEATEHKNIRLVISLPNSIKIVGGSGTRSNPYNINTENCYYNSSLVNRILSHGFNNKSATLPGREYAVLDEGLRTAEDDYGISYYFRGDVKNNYVVFAEKCWKIVRITGNASVKMILHNYAGRNCNANGDMGYIYNGGLLKSKFNNSINDNTYIGYKYNTNDTTYDITHENNRASTIFNNLKDWYINNLQSYDNQIADVIWCNDKSLISGSGIGTKESYYGASNRINGEPSLICPNGSGTNKNISKFTAYDNGFGNGSLENYKIGLLTIDELLYSGFVGNENNGIYSKSYLIKNANHPWWTISPAFYSSASAWVYGVNNAGIIIPYKVNDSTLSIRPVIAIKGELLVSGAGTINDPYIIINS